MFNLAESIDRMLPPEVPSYFSAEDKEIVLLAIAASKHRARPFDGEYKGAWLLSDYTAVEWITTNRNREEEIEGEWSSTININWAIRLPDGSLLTDVKNHRLLDLNKRIAFLIRSGFVGHISAPITWRATISVQLQLTRWLVLHASQFRPNQFGFSQLDQFSLAALFRDIAEGGWAEAHKVVRRLLEKIYQSTFNERCPNEYLDSPYKLPVDVAKKITMRLASKGWYGCVVSGRYVGKSYLKRERIAEEIDEPVDSLRASSKFAVFCRQFEPELNSGELVVSLFQFTEKPNHKTKTFEEIISVGAAENTLSSVSSTLTTILSAHRHCGDLLPEPLGISIRKAHNEAVKKTRKSGHHPFIPVPIGLAYFNNAIKLVHVYGSALIDYYLAVVGDRLPYSTLDSRCSGDFGINFKVQDNGSLISVGKALGINKFMRLDIEGDFDGLRTNPTLDEALRVLVGACVICIGLMKPSRDDELTNLQRNCLRKNGDGYYLHSEIGKSGGGEALQDTDRPIPVITAKAIQLMQKLGNGLSTLFNDTSKAAGKLFYLPKQRGEGALAAGTSLLSTNLDLFCDYVGLDTDYLGRRWYLRVHEMRKWFLLLLFWSGKFDVLDAARWMASHADASHIYAYIEREFPGEELPQLEAEYAIDRLRTLEAANGRGGRHETGLDALYEKVLNHFQVQSLSMVPDIEWVGYVEALREAEGFTLKPHSVHYSDDMGSLVGMVVSFVLREDKS